MPAGKAPLPSTALMLGVPARLAGCATRVLCSPVQATASRRGRALRCARRRRPARVQARRRTGHRRHGVRHRERAEGRQGVRARQHLGHGSESPSGSRSSGCCARLPGGPFRGARHRGRQRQSRVRRGGSACRRPSTARTLKCCWSRRAASSGGPSIAAVGRAEGAPHARQARRRRARALERHRRRRPCDGVRDCEPLRARAPDPADRAAARRGSTR